MKFWRTVIRIMESLVNLMILLCFLPILFFGVYAVWDSQQIYKQADQTLYQTYRPVATADESFAELRAINPDVFGWLMVDGTNIDYPLVQSDTNSKYVNTDVKGEFSLSGSIFLDCRNDIAFTDVNSIIYGHHMQKDAMFGSLDQFADPDFFDTHSHGKLFYGDAWHPIEFFAFVNADAYDPVLFNAELDGSEGNQIYLDYVKEHAEVFRALSFAPDEHYIALSTCADTSTNGRHLLIGRIVGDPA